MRWNVDTHLLLIKAHYFFWHGGMASVIPFLPIYARHLGFSSLAVGTIYSVITFSGIIAKPVFGVVADRFQLPKSMFVILQATVAVVFFAIQFIPDVPVHTPVTMYCEYMTYFAHCNTSLVDDALFDLLDMEGVITCQVQCNATDSLYHEMCEQWKAPQYCSDMSPHEQFINFEAEIPLNHSMQFSNCMHFQVHKVFLDDNTVHIPYCEDASMTDCSVHCKDRVFNEIITRFTKGGSTDMSQTYQFWLLLLFMMIGMMTTATIVTIGDTICLRMLGEESTRFGFQRLWGAVGWGTASLIAGLLVDEFSANKLRINFTPLFYLCLVMMICDICASSKLQYNEIALSKNITHDVGRLLLDLRIVVFILWCVFVGICTGGLWQFLFWLLEDLSIATDKSWVQTLQGLVMTVRCFGGELPFFFFSNIILKKIGHVHAMSLVLAVLALRFLLYSILSNPWWCLPIELLQGVTYGVFYATKASFSSIESPPGAEGTVQGFVGAFEGIGISIGSFLGGMLYDSCGGSKTFFIYGLTALFACLIHILIQYFLPKSPRLKSHSSRNGVFTMYATPNDAMSLSEHFDEPR